jgi:hypothetical protein
LSEGFAQIDISALQHSTPKARPSQVEPVSQDANQPIVESHGEWMWIEFAALYLYKKGFGAIIDVSGDSEARSSIRNPVS